MTTPKIEAEDVFIDALDSGISLHVRNKRPAGMERFEAASTLVMMHGRGGPGPASFDISLPGYSWMDWMAARGWDVWTFSVRGFGRSTKPPELLVADPEGRPPVIRGRTAVRDLSAVVDYVCERRGVDSVNLLGWSWGTTISPAYAADNNDRVGRLALYAPYYCYDNPARAAQFENPDRPGEWDVRRGAWIWESEETVARRWWGHIPGDIHHKWRDPKALRTYIEDRLHLDPEGATRNPPAIRTPNGSLLDAYERAKNIPIYDASRVERPVLLIYGDRDGAANPVEAWGLYEKLTASPEKRYIVISDATHFLHYEYRREVLFREVQLFLEC